MSKLSIPHVGLRTIKTSLAVMICLCVFLPLESLIQEHFSSWLMIGPLNACVAAIICMQSSFEDSVHQGLIRLRGTAIGGAVGLAVLFLYNLYPCMPLLIVLVGLSMVFIIWFCILIRRPKACGIACIVCCTIALTQTDTGLLRYAAALSRMVETAGGILIALAVNRLLPGLPRTAHEETE